MEDPFIIGTKFNTLKNVEQAITAYSKDNSVHLYKRDSLTLTSAQKTKPNRVAAAKQSLRYYYLTYACVKGGRPHKTRSLGKRRSRTVRDGCGMRVKFGLAPDGQSMVVTEYKSEHNHDNVHEKIFFKLPRRPKLEVDAVVTQPAEVVEDFQDAEKVKEQLTIQEKFREVSRECFEIAGLVSEQGDAEFKDALKKLKYLRRILSENKDWNILAYQESSSEMDEEVVHSKAY